MFKTREDFDAVKKSGVITKELISELYNVPTQAIITENPNILGMKPQRRINSPSGNSQSPQKTPATGWERQIDELMTRQLATLDEPERRKLFNEVQGILARHEPAIYFVAPRVFAAASGFQRENPMTAIAANSGSTDGRRTFAPRRPSPRIHR